MYARTPFRGVLLIPVNATKQQPGNVICYQGLIYGILHTPFLGVYPTVV